jgi:hypothetical protein
LDLLCGYNFRFFGKLLPKFYNVLFQQVELRFELFWIADLQSLVYILQFCKLFLDVVPLFNSVKPSLCLFISFPCHFLNDQVQLSNLLLHLRYPSLDKLPSMFGFFNFKF